MRLHWLLLLSRLCLHWLLLLPRMCLPWLRSCQLLGLLLGLPMLLGHKQFWLKQLQQVRKRPPRDKYTLCAGVPFVCSCYGVY